MANCADGGAGSLRDAVANATNGDTIDLSKLRCATITLTSGAITTTLESLAIRGPGQATLAIDGSGSDRVLYHAGSGTLVVSNVTLRNGHYVASGYEAGFGGCVASAGNVIIDHVTVSSCYLSSYASYGGGVFAGGTAKVSASTISANTVHGSALALGGGISTYGGLNVSSSSISGNTIVAESIGYRALANGAAMGTLFDLTVSDSVITGNSATADSPYPNYDASAGNTVVSFAGTLTLTRSTVSGNSAHSSANGSSAGGYLLAISYGGGVRAPTLVITGSTISGNSVYASASNPSGASYAYAKGGGLATWGSHGSVTLANSTISGNSVKWSGDSSTYGFSVAGGMFSWGQVPTLTSSTIAFNTSETGSGVFLYATAAMTVNSSIIASNFAGLGGAGIGNGSPGAVSMNGANNLIASADSSVSLPPDTMSVDPMLAPLADNGGPTYTHALLNVSPAIDAGNNAAALTFDQRGNGHPRLVGAAPDIGAFEVKR